MVLGLRPVEGILLVGNLLRVAVLRSVGLGRVGNIVIWWWRWLVVCWWLIICWRWWRWWRRWRWWRLIVMWLMVRLVMVVVLLHVVPVAGRVHRNVVTFRLVVRFMVIFMMGFMVRFMVRFVGMFVMVEKNRDRVVGIVIMSSEHWDHHVVLYGGSWGRRRRGRGYRGSWSQH